MSDDLTISDTERFEATFVQKDRGLRFGLWGCYDYEYGRTIAYGAKGKMQRLARLLNDETVTVRIES